MSLDSVLGHTATTMAPDLSTIASIGSGGPEIIESILAKLFDGARARVAPARGGLAPWQVLRVKTHVEAHLDSPMRAGDLAAIARLSPDERLPLVLYFYLDLPLDEVARTLRVSPAAAKSRIYRAAQRLRSDLTLEEVS